MSGKGEDGSGGGGNDDKSTGEGAGVVGVLESLESAKARVRRERQEAAATASADGEAAGGFAAKPGAESVSAADNNNNMYGAGRLADVKLRSSQQVAEGGAKSTPTTKSAASSSRPPPSSNIITPGAHYGEGRLADIKSADARGGKKGARSAAGGGASRAATEQSRTTVASAASAKVAPDLLQDSVRSYGSAENEGVARVIIGEVGYDEEGAAAMPSTSLKATASRGASQPPQVIRGEVGYDAEDGTVVTRSGEGEGFGYSVQSGLGENSAGVVPMMHDDAREEDPFRDENSPVPNIVDGPAVARAVSPDEIEEEEAEFKDIPTATGYDPNKAGGAVSWYRTNRGRAFLAVFVCVLIAVVVGVSVGTTVGNKSSGGGGSTSPPTPEPTMPPTPAYYLQTVEEYLSEQIGDQVNTAGTPYNDALNWIENVDPMNMTTKAENLLRRYLLAVVYYSSAVSGDGDAGWTRCGASDPPSSLEDETCVAVLDDNGFEVDPYTSTRWLSGADECEWMGTVCVEGGTLVDIVLVENNLRGTLVPELYQISTLQGLTLRGNALTGSIPTEFGLMPSLLQLHVNSNRLKGGLPLADLYGIELLQEFNVYNNGLTGTLAAPPAGAWPRMESLSFGTNGFSGQIPGQLGDLPRVVVMDFFDNSFTGPVPPGLGNAASLEKLFLEQNALTGSIPTEFGRMSSLLQLNVNSNRLTGPLPLADLYGLEMLQEFNVYNNGLTGTLAVPPAGAWPQMESLSLGMNDFSGPIPGQLGDLPLVWYMDFFNNSFTGPVPPGLGNAISLETLFLELNDLTGIMPQEVCDLRGVNGRLVDLVVDCVEVECVIPDCCTACDNSSAPVAI